MDASGLKQEGFDALVKQEIQRLLLRLWLVRFWLLLIILLAFAGFAIWEPVGWKLATLAVLAAVMTSFFTLEYRRARREFLGAGNIQLNLLAMLGMQTVMILLLGGIEGPFLFVYIPLCFGAGVMLGDPKRVFPVIAFPAAVTVLFACGHLFGWFPRTLPAFFDLRDGAGHRPVLIWATAFVAVFMMVITAALSAQVRRTLEQQVREGYESRMQALAELDGRNGELQSISRTIAHELKNPLASIQGLAQLLMRGVDPQSKLAERLEVMQREIARMATVLEGFRDMTRPLSGLTLSWISLEALAAEVTLLVEGMASARGVQVSLRQGGDLRVRCDPLKVKQALTNLVQNALEATPAGGAVTLAVREGSGGRIEVEVSDTGCGLSEEVRQKLFEPGFTTKQGGSGIGLLVARSIVTQHGGELRVENRVEGGCRIAICLPIQPAAGAEEGA